MPLNPGSSTLTFSPPGNFVVDQYHTQPASQGLTAFAQPGCMVQTAGVKDKVENTVYAEATHRVYTPYNASTGAVAAEWHVAFGSKSFRILGAHRTPDSWGRIYQCLFICKEEQG